MIGSVVPSECDLKIAAGVPDVVSQQACTYCHTRKGLQHLLLCYSKRLQPVCMYLGMDLHTPHAGSAFRGRIVLTLLPCDRLQQFGIHTVIHGTDDCSRFYLILYIWIVVDRAYLCLYLRRIAVSLRQQVHLRIFFVFFPCQRRHDRKYYRENDYCYCYTVPVVSLSHSLISSRFLAF